LIFKEICLNAAWHGIWFQRSIRSLVVWLKSSIGVQIINSVNFK
jgi:hypothetical protein